MRTYDTSAKLLQWIDNRMDGATHNIVEALQFMRNQLLNESFDPPERWRLGHQARLASLAGPTYNDAADSYLKLFQDLLGPSLCVPPNERRALVQAAIDGANEFGSSIYWNLHKARLAVADAPRARADDFQRLASVTLELTLEYDKGNDTKSINIRLSEILEILPLLPGSQFEDASIRRALIQLDQNRLDGEIARCFDSLERHIEFYHPTRTATNPTIVPGFMAIVHTMDPAQNRRWKRYNNRVLEQRRNNHQLGDVVDYESGLPAEHPYRKIAAQMRDKPRGDKQLAMVAGSYRFQLFTEDLKRLTQAGLGAVEANLKLRATRQHTHA